MNAKLSVFARSLLCFALLYLVNPHTRAVRLGIDLFKATLLRFFVGSPTESGICILARYDSVVRSEQHMRIEDAYGSRHKKKQKL